jgi:transcriptional regulatory protein RtcR
MRRVARASSLHSYPIIADVIFTDMSRRPLNVIGIVGPVLDSGRGLDRWSRWRPSVSLCQHDDLIVDRFDLLYQPQFTNTQSQVCQDVAAVSPETKVVCHPIAMTDPWDFESVYGVLLDFARGYPFNPEAEDYLVHITTGSHVAQICLFLLTESRYFPAKLIQTIPPGKRRPDGAGSYAIIDLDLSKYDRLASRFNLEQRESTSALKGGIQTRNKAFNALIEQVEHVAVASKSPMLLTGPTGAGKSQLAKRIFELKRHRRKLEGKFVEVNCATLRGDGAMSTLFGHKKGAFTGAVTDRPGLLRAADGGMLFLDEIGELGADEQAMMLRAIEDKRFTPLGADADLSSDFQLIAGTNADLQAAVRAGRFREDLLARINLWTFALPPLKDRREDIEPNLDFELEQYTRQQGTKVTFNKEAREAYLAFATAPDAAWNGNFRDLNASVMRMGTFAAGGRIGTGVVSGEIVRLRGAWSRAAATTTGAADLGSVLDPSMLEAIDLFDRVQLAEVVRVCRESRTLSDAGRKLFAASRLQKGSSNDSDRLKKYLARFGLKWSDLRAD